jgi:hypothetical protein
MSPFERDFDKDPYDKHEKQVCEYLTLIAPDIGCGTDPVGFLIASHNELRRQLQQLRAAVKQMLPQRINKD